MSSRSYGFFATRSEAVTVVTEVVDRLHLVLLVDGGGIESVRICTVADLEPLDPARPANFLLSRTAPSQEILRDLQLTPARWGWVSLELPQEREYELLMGHIAAINEWSDGEVVWRSDESYELYKRILAAFKRLSVGRVSAHHLQTGAHGPARGIGVFASGRDWVARRCPPRRHRQECRLRDHLAGFRP